MGPEGCIHTHNDTKLESTLDFNIPCIHCAALYTKDWMQNGGGFGTLHILAVQQQPYNLQEGKADRKSKLRPDADIMLLS